MAASPPGGGSPAFAYVLPVLFLEFLATSLAKGVLPHRLVDFFGEQTYSVIAAVEAVKGLLAFYFCPYLGRLSDTEGRRRMLLLTVLGTCLPFCTLAFTENLWYYVVTQAIAGAFAATFAITFAYIADTVEVNARAPAYGLALATFGLSFCIGPVTGSVLSERYPETPRFVFMGTVLLTAIDLLYIVYVLPETCGEHREERMGLAFPHSPAPFKLRDAYSGLRRGVRQVRSRVEDAWLGLSAGAGDVAHSLPTRMGLVLGDAVAILLSTPLLRRVSEIVFLYYCGVWALVSTLMVYVTRQLGFTTVMVGQLMSAYGLCTMISEGVLVRIMVPLFGEPFCAVLGLAGFALQCVIIAFADRPFVMYLSMVGALFANLFYPSISALISRTVSPAQQGEALGALNGIKSLCEGVGPLVFGTLMTASENTAMPGAPYLVAAAAAAVAGWHALDLPKLVEADLERQKRAESTSAEKQSLLRDGEASFVESDSDSDGEDPEGGSGGSPSRPYSSSGNFSPQPATVTLTLALTLNPPQP
uniref:Major facilitator superfamily (MFS) profile domain-containing protein n=2 Tax=Phaeomonas parva TaxID=124430 RepID=A0A7S1UFU1_9STRA|mmetsp:Transcript_45797/g.143271  ORF Transcript_45797/g.143271 Transcript_45797/m.143271 type:complete len:531 (+) Transcript_45797:227-1819(+)